MPYQEEKEVQEAKAEEAEAEEKKEEASEEVQEAKEEEKESSDDIIKSLSERVEALEKAFKDFMGVEDETSDEITEEEAQEILEFEDAIGI